MNPSNAPQIASRRNRNLCQDELALRLKKPTIVSGESSLPSAQNCPTQDRCRSPMTIPAHFLASFCMVYIHWRFLMRTSIREMKTLKAYFILANRNQFGLESGVQYGLSCQINGSSVINPFTILNGVWIDHGPVRIARSTQLSKPHT